MQAATATTNLAFFISSCGSPSFVLASFNNSFIVFCKRLTRLIKHGGMTSRLHGADKVIAQILDKTLY
jgi:hypothetical protein